MSKLFPACAGVILITINRKIIEESFPRVCGGDPVKMVYLKQRFLFSPRVRG